MANVNMSRREAVSIIERRNAGHAVDHVDPVTASAVIAQDEQPRTHGRQPRHRRGESLIARATGCDDSFVTCHGPIAVQALAASMKC
jgi:hypothetical protein